MYAPHLFLIVFSPIETEGQLDDRRHHQILYGDLHENHGDSVAGSNDVKRLYITYYVLHQYFLLPRLWVCVFIGAHYVILYS